MDRWIHQTWHVPACKDLTMMEKRGSGILLHITSLPSPYGVGDLGAGAHEFADFLAESHQSFWQILPLTPTCSAYGNSPYSSFSAYAGNPLLISPEKMVSSGFLPDTFLKDHKPFSQNNVNYKKHCNIRRPFSWPLTMTIKKLF